MMYNARTRKRSLEQEIKLHQAHALKRSRWVGSDGGGFLTAQKHGDIAEEHVEQTPKPQLDTERVVGAEVVAGSAKHATTSGGVWHAWWNVEDDGHIHRNLCRILRNAGYGDQLLWLLSQPQWTVKRLVKSGILSVERDLYHGQAMCSDTASPTANHKEHLQMIGRAARLGALYVCNNRRVQEGWFQIHGRLLWHATQNKLTSDFVQRMEACAPRPWFKASTALMRQAGDGELRVMKVEGDVLSTRVESGVIWILKRDYNEEFLYVESYDTSSENYKQQKLEKHQSIIGIECASFLPDQRTVVTAHDDGRICVWNRKTGVYEQTVAHDCANHRRFVNFCAGGTRLACEMKGVCLQLWDTLSGNAVGQALKGHRGRVACMALSVDGTCIVSGAWDRTVRVWDAESGNAIGQALQGHTDIVKCVVVNADGTCIVSGSWDKTVRVWDAESGKAVGQPLYGHTHPVKSAALSVDGTCVVSGDKESQRLWALNGDGGECVLTSRDAGWQRIIDTLELTWSKREWPPPQRKVRDLAEDGSEIVLGSCERALFNIDSGDVYVTEDFRSCRIVR